MIKSIGIDMVCISEIGRLMDVFGDTYINHTFTKNEIDASAKATDKAEFFAARFAVKEAVFKAVAHLTKEKTFDMRIIETANDDSGYPYVCVNNELKILLDQAGIGELLISITTEGDFATAIAAANPIS